MFAAVILMTICSSAEMTEVRLVDGDHPCSGTPEVLNDGKWWKVSSTYVYFQQGAMLCRELDCGSVVSVTSQSDFRASNENEHLLYMLCQGKESNFSQCSQVLPREASSSFIALVCSDSVRLVDGDGCCSGRVEVKSQQTWTTVYEADFDWQDAEVVCRELGCGAPRNLQGALFGEGKHPFGNKEFQCEGLENHLLNCNTSPRDGQSGKSGKPVGLTCSGPDDVRLVNGSNRCTGTVQMFYNGQWRTVGSDVWSMKDADVVCRQLGCGSAVASAKTVSGTGSGLPVFCGGSESALRECHAVDSAVSNFLGRVMCSGLLAKPTISFSTPKRVSRTSKIPEVYKGHSFTITCSTTPQYPGGFFYLKLPWTQSFNQAAVNHSVSFRFHAADHSHQGSYSCVYENQEIYKVEDIFIYSFHPTFFSESEPLSLIVTDSPLPAAITRILLVPVVLLIICLLIYIIFKKWGHYFIRNASGYKGTAAVLQMSSIQTNTEDRSLERST